MAKYTEEIYKKDLNDPDNHDGVVTYLEPGILECKVKRALGSITMNKASRGDGIPAKLFQILKDDAVKVLHSMPANLVNSVLVRDWKRSVFIPSHRMALSKNVQTAAQLHSFYMLAK